MWKNLVVLAVLFVTSGVDAVAETASAVRLRGKIDTIDAHGATMTTREGNVVRLAIGPDTRYSTVKAMNMSDIKAGTFIGAAGKAGKDGTIEALEVVVFPEDLRGTGEGHYAWDLLPESSMTNATVAAVAESSAGQDLNLAYKNGTKQIHVPKNVPVVTILSGEMSDVRPGVQVFVVAVPKATGEFSVSRIIIGKNGVAPPM